MTTLIFVVAAIFVASSIMSEPPEPPLGPWAVV